ncbi:helix-turn-helix domain-containing protein [Streptomyces sp. ET3-23]|uniref:helix-turn-helix domain-containing protein n=1 Tax=Streptomyces sp. ET3-23 TaxID=2885643 RepID=UPI001D113EC7|nr:helix-turn-helix transcriptional regulator [Streptomyces sp. ET3-23]MCC2279771.1 helix-turn-helix domain-containing protein [Streptomyces sp. ET3-23]
MPEHEPPAGFPARLLAGPEMIEACRDHDFSAIFQLARRAGMYPALIGRRIGVTPSAATEILKGRRTVREFQLVERIADGLRIPGHMLGLSRRGWEPDTDEDASQAACLVPALVWAPNDASAEGLRPMWPEDEPDDPEFVAEFIESQLPQHYKDANYFGSRHAIPAVTQYALTVTRLLDTASGSPRQALLCTGGKVAEFVGWLHQDLGDFKSAAYWSDRAMEWAQEAAAEHMQAYILFRKSNQATARTSGDRVVGLAKAAQRLPGLTPRLSALAAQQEAQGYAIMRNPKAALTRFDEAHSLASQATDAEQSTTVDASYCTPTYIELQRATCWIGLGQPRRAVRLFQDQLANLDPLYRNDRGVYLARLARAHVAAGDVEQGAGAATKSLAIVTHTGSARTFAELSSVAGAVEAQRTLPAVATFFERFETVRERFAA